MDSHPRFEPTEGASDETFQAGALNPSSLPKALHIRSLPQSCIDSSIKATSVADTICSPSTPEFSSTRISINVPSSGQTTGTDSAHIFFTDKIGGSNQKRVERLVDVVQGFSKTRELSDEFYTLFGCELSRTFRSKPESIPVFEAEPVPTFEGEAASRLRQLGVARLKIPKEDSKILRLWLVFLAHEVEHISLHNDIECYTAKGVGRISVAQNIAEKYIDTAKKDYRRSQNFVKLLEEGGPSSLLESWDTTFATWEKDINRRDIAHIFAYRRDKLPQLDNLARLQGPAAARTIVNGFVAYGWTFAGLLSSDTKVMGALKPYLQEQRSRSDAGLGTDESKDNHNLQASSLDSSAFYQASPKPTVESNSTPPISFNTRDLTDPVTLSSLSNAVNGTGQVMDPATVGNLGHAVSSLDELPSHRMSQLTDPFIELVPQTANWSDELIDWSPRSI